MNSPDRCLDTLSVRGFVLVAFAGAALLQLLAPYAIVDDAYISFRYVHNLAAHGELVFNRGERVEGATNLGWVVLLASIARALGTDIALTAFVVSLALNAFTLARVWQISGQITSNPLRRHFAVLLLALNVHFVLATTNGLEAALYSALLAETLAWVVRRRLVVAAVFAGLLFVVRPDGAIVSFALLAVALSAQVPRRAVLVPGLVIIVLFGATTLFRLSYFGEPVPNSIVAKSYGLAFLPQTLLMAAVYIAKFVLANGYLLVAPLGLAWQVRRNFKLGVDVPLLFCATVLALAGIVTVRNGGDWMPHSRLLLQYGPIWAVLSLIAVERLEWSPRQLRRLLIWPALAAVVALFVERDGIGRLQQPGGVTAFWAESAGRLEPVVRPEDRISAEALGFVSYRLLAVPFHDPIGLVDRYLARHGIPAPRYGKSDPRYTLGVVRPTVALWHYAPHLAIVPREVLRCYELRAYQGDTNKLMMIRNDVAPRISRVVNDWVLMRPEDFSTISSGQPVACSAPAEAPPQ